MEKIGAWIMSNWAAIVTFFDKLYANLIALAE